MTVHKMIYEQSVSIYYTLSNMTENFYPIEFHIQYTNDKEYRSTIRTLCNMSSNIVALSQPLDEDIDEITRDEWDYDQDAITKLLDFVYSSTVNEPILNAIYQTAAGFMLSEDPNIGLAVLFSYDYLMDFHPVLCDYFRCIQYEYGTKTFDSTIPSVIHLRQRLSR